MLTIHDHHLAGLCVIGDNALGLLGHLSGEVSGGLQSGLLHPISGLDHVLAMVAVGLWGAQLGAPQVWVLPLVFPLVMACGAALGIMGVHIPGVEVGIATSAIVLGCMVLFAARPPLVVSSILVGVFAIFHGHAHGAELPHGESGILFSIGFVIGTGLLHAAGIGIGSLHRWPWGEKCLRFAGAIVLMGGCYFLGNSLGWIA